MPLLPRIVATGLFSAMLAGTVAVPAASAAPARPDRADRTSRVEQLRVDRVPTPHLGWYACYDYAECATVKLPLDYDSPNGAQVKIAVLRVKARDQKNRIGSLFINPGGPGGQGTAVALAAPGFLGDDVLDRFDVVGFDPRGIGASENVRCFRSAEEQGEVLAPLLVAFPWTRSEEQAYVAASKKVGKACSRTAEPLIGAMSTAEAARDLDVLRRAVGDQRLSFLGFSYGSAVGQYYANMFPDRVRAIAVDGIVDPRSWVGNGKARDIVLDDRLRSADGAYKALREILVRCAAAGRARCALADGDPLANYDRVARRLRSGPVVVDSPTTGKLTVTYADFIGATLGMLYDPSGYQGIVDLTQELLTLTGASATGAQKDTAGLSLAGRIRRARALAYDNRLEMLLGVACTDGQHPRDAGSWPARSAESDRRAPYFGRAWAWGTAPCARDTWTARDEDAYHGPFDRRTAAPVLLVGNYHDPSTNYDEAVAAARALPNGRLLSSDSWGHTAYGTSKCTTDAVNGYLVDGTLPAEGTVCVGDIQPFAPVPAQAAGTAKRLPPVAPRLPGTVFPSR